MKKITAYDPAWKDCFACERDRLCGIFGSAALCVHHIGSTSIPGIWSKPVIDILVEADALAHIDACAAGMEAIGYEPRGEYGIPGRRYFSMRFSDLGRTGAHVHVYEQGSPHVTRHLAFRDYLLEKPEVAAAYSNLKRNIADASGKLPLDYAARKEGFVRAVEKTALEYFAMAASPLN